MKKNQGFFLSAAAGWVIVKTVLVVGGILGAPSILKIWGSQTEVADPVTGIPIYVWIVGAIILLLYLRPRRHVVVVHR